MKSHILKSMAENIENTASSQTIRGIAVPHVRRLASILAGFEGTIQSRMAGDTPERHVERIVDSAGKIRAKAQTVSDTLLRQIGDAHNRLEAQAREKAGIKPTNGPEAAEIRAIVRGMSRKSQLELLKSRDPEVLNALVGANPLLHGIDKATLDATVNDMLNHAAPEETAEMAELTEFLGTVSVITREATEAATQATDDEYTREVLRKAQEAEGVHNEFLSKLEEVGS